MYKLLGSIFVIMSTVFMFSIKTMEKYYTYKHLCVTVEIINKLQFEKNSSHTYTTLYKKIGFDRNSYTEKAKQNIFTDETAVRKTEEFFDNLGKRDTEGEQQYLEYNLKNFENMAEYYRNEYTENRKIRLLCGGAAGIFVVLILI